MGNAQLSFVFHTAEGAVAHSKAAPRKTRAEENASATAEANGAQGLHAPKVSRLVTKFAHSIPSRAGSNKH